MDVKNDLYAVLLRGKTTEECIEEMVSHGVERHYYEYVKEVKPLLYEEIKKCIEKQKEINYFKLAEVKNLSDSFFKHKIQLVHLKGITLAYDLYPDNPDIRKSNDIDVLIAAEESERALNLLGEMGYYVRDTKEKVSAEINKKYYKNVIDRGIHYPEFEKIVTLNSKAMVLKMDCHLSISHSMDDKVKKMKQIISRCVAQKIDNSNVMVLEIHDRLIYLALHFTKEFLRNYVRWGIIGSRRVDENKGINFAHLYDIALLIEKYSKQIRWTTIWERALELNSLDEVIFTVKCLKELFHGLTIKIPEVKSNLCEDVYKVKKYGIYYPIQLIYENIDSIIFKNIKELSRTILQKSENRKEELYANQKYYINKVFGELIIGCLLAEKKEDAIGHIEFLSNENALIICVHIDNIEKYSYFTFSIGSSMKNQIFNSYIVKFMLNINSYNTYYNTYTITANNAYGKMEFYNWAKSELGDIFIAIPWGILPSQIKDKGYFLFEIDFPELFNKIEISANRIPKFKVNGLSFPYNPDILQKVQLGKDKSL